MQIRVTKARNEVAIGLNATFRAGKRGWGWGHMNVKE